jgi:hypothetical protein
MLRSLLVLGLACGSLSACTAQEGKPSTALSPEEAGPDFPLQGEYSGPFRGDEAKKLGVQVIALGDGRFRAVGYVGGLPGDGWNGEEKHAAESTVKNGEVVFKGEEGEATLADGRIVVRVDGNEVATLEKVERKSPTLGAEPPEGAVVLFGGKADVDKWEQGRVTEDGLLMQGITSKQTFGEPFTLHLEFQLCFMPPARDQARSNSGVYLQGRYEVQILDSFGLEGKNNEAGGVYEISDPSVNMCLPPLAWQTYDIDFTPARFEGETKVASARLTVRHNGIVVQDDVQVPRTTRAAPQKEGPEPGPIYVQDHGNPVRFRNVWVLPGR